jgi:uncharacterized protein
VKRSERPASDSPANEVAVQVVDVDVHPYPRSLEELRPYIPKHFRDLYYNSTETFPSGSAVYTPPRGGLRRDAIGPDGAPPASDPAFTEKQLFERAGVDYAILFPLSARPDADPEHNAALCAATNDWLADTWLSKYNNRGIYRGTIMVNSARADLAVREIERWIGHPYVVQIFLDARTITPLGQPQFHAIYDAAQRNGLVVALHPLKGPGMGLLTPVGFPTYFMENHSQYAPYFAATLTSLVFEGVLDKYPDLKFAFIETGFSWIVPLMWRLDRYWEELRKEVPWVKRRPSDAIRAQVRFSTQPFETPTDPHDLERVFELAGSDSLFMFSTDYPHHDADDPTWIVRQLPARLRKRVLRDNAIEFYGLPETRPRRSGIDD